MKPEDALKLANEIIAWDEGKKPRNAGTWIHGDTITLAREVVRLSSPIPEGMVLVPREPPRVMLKAGADALSDEPADALDVARDVYRAMLAASGEKA